MQRRKLLTAPATLSVASALPVIPAKQAGMESLQFGPNFNFGISTSAYQIEGAVHEGGRAPSIWDVFCHEPHHITDGDTADVACDHYHRMPEDIDLIAGAGIKNYRFSICWSRLFPTDDRTPNATGFGFYDLLIDRLLAKNIAPWMCLYHWDLPQRLQERGGWRNRDTSARLAEFSDQVSRHFGDRVSHWMVLNEAAVHSRFGHGVGVHAPGLTGMASWASALHHLNLGQGLTIQALRANGVKGRIGTVACVEPIWPSTDKPEDVAAAQRLDAMWNGAVLDPLLAGHYPELVAEYFEPFCQPGDLEQTHQPIDLLGVNYYSRLHIQADPSVPLDANFGPDHAPVKYTALGWPIEPDGLPEILMRITNTYNRQEIFISENGFATVQDGRPVNGLRDASRIAYLQQHLSFLKKAIDQGANVSGYFVWTLLDDFEWDGGLKWRFGLVDVDYETQKRTPKDSYHWYAQVIKLNTAVAA